MTTCILRRHPILQMTYLPCSSIIVYPPKSENTGEGNNNKAFPYKQLSLRQYVTKTLAVEKYINNKLLKEKMLFHPVLSSYHRTLQSPPYTKVKAKNQPQSHLASLFITQTQSRLS